MSLFHPLRPIVDMNPQDYIPRPCHENWDTMTGNQQQKFCDKCSCSVHNLTGMEHQQIMDLRSELGGKLCGVFQQQHQNDTSNQLKKKIRRIHLRKSLVLGASISTLALAACQPEKDQVLLGECGSGYVPESEASPDDSTTPIKPIQPPVKPHVLMSGICPEEEVKPPRQEPKILGKIYIPKKPKE